MTAPRSERPAGAAASPRRYVGQALTRREDERVLRGRARYVDDIELRGHGARRVRAQPARVRAGRRGPGPADASARRVRRRHAGRPRRAREAVPEGRDRRDGGLRRPAPGAGGRRGPLRGPTRRGGRRRVARAGRGRSPRRSRSTTTPLEAVVDPRASDEALVRWTHAGGDVDGAFARAAHVVSARATGWRGSRRCRSRRAARSPSRTATSGLLTVWCSAQDTHRPLAQLAAHPRPPAGDDPRASCPTSAARSGRRATRRRR